MVGTVADKQTQQKKLTFNDGSEKPSELIETHLRSLPAKFQLILSSRSLLNYHLRNLYLRILAGPWKKSVKSWTIAESLFLLKRRMFIKFGEFLWSHSSLKKSKISPPEVQIIDYSSYIIMAKKRRNITGLRNQSKSQDTFSCHWRSTQSQHGSHWDASNPPCDPCQSRC